MRHGESEANTAGIIVSSPGTGIKSFGLTLRGRDQVYESIDNLPMSEIITIVFSSDFLRARQTALISADIFGITEIIEVPELRERYFGNYDSRDDSLYEEVWAIDRSQPDEYPHNIESPVSVMQRVSDLINSCEEKFEGEGILLVSHGDTLQIIQTLFAALSPFEHRTIPHLKKAEIRRLEKTHC